MPKLSTSKDSQNGSRGHSLHAHIETIIRNRIREGVYPPGMLMPGRRALCEDLDVAPSTLEKAIKHLLADGTLRSENRRGTFVADTILPPDASADAGHNTVVRAPQSESTYRIGIVDVDMIKDLTTMRPEVTWFEYLIVHAVESQISSQGSQLVYSRPQKNGDHKLLNDVIAEFRSNGAHAIIFLAYHNPSEIVESVLDKARSAGIAPIVLSSSPHEWSCPHVWTDSRVAGRQAAEHLLNAGHRQIVFIAPFDHEWQELRVQGVQDAMRSAGLNDDRLIVIRNQPGDPDWNSAYEEAAEAGALLFQRAVDQFGPIRAVIGPNDWVSVGIARAIEELGFEIGSEIALVSFDDTMIARQYELSSVRFPLEQLGTEAAMLALRAASGEKIQHRLRIGCSLILRGSTSSESQVLI